MKNLLFFMLLVSSPIILMICQILVIKVLKMIGLKYYSPQKMLLLCELLLNIPILISVYFLYTNISSIVYAFMVYNCLGYSYFHFFNMSETARRIKILLEIKKSNKITIDDLQHIYSSDSIIKNRIERLLESGQIIKNDNKYYQNSFLLVLFANIISFLREVLLFE